MVKILNKRGVYGTKGTPAAGNKPGGRYQATTCVDNDGNVWFLDEYGYGTGDHQCSRNDHIER